MICLKIDVAFKYLGQDFEFKASLNPGQKHVFEIGERGLCDKLFYVLCGLDKDYKGGLEGADWSESKTNSVLALGDRTMFVRGTVETNIYKALRSRMGRGEAKQKTQEVIGIYLPELCAGETITKALVTEFNMLKVALARAHYRDIKLVVINCFETYASADCNEVVNHFTNRGVPYIIEIH